MIFLTFPLNTIYTNKLSCATRIIFLLIYIHYEHRFVNHAESGWTVLQYQPDPPANPTYLSISRGLDNLCTDEYGQPGGPLHLSGLVGSNTAVLSCGKMVCRTECFFDAKSLATIETENLSNISLMQFPFMYR